MMCGKTKNIQSKPTFRTNKYQGSWLKIQISSLIEKQKKFIKQNNFCNTLGKDKQQQARINSRIEIKTFVSFNFIRS